MGKAFSVLPKDWISINNFTSQFNYDKQDRKKKRFFLRIRSGFLLEKGMNQSLKTKSGASFWTHISICWQTPLILGKLFCTPTTVTSQYYWRPPLVFYTIENMICNDMERRPAQASGAFHPHEVGICIPQLPQFQLRFTQNMIYHYLDQQFTIETLSLRLNRSVLSTVSPKLVSPFLDCDIAHCEQWQQNLFLTGNCTLSSVV